jgi:hypothetical protein
MPGMDSRKQFDMPDPQNGMDHGRTVAQKGSATPKAASFKAGPLEAPVSGGKFKDYTKVNDLSVAKFKQKGVTEEV